MKIAFVANIIQEVGLSLGYDVILEPEFGYVGEVIFPNGKRHLFRNNNLNLNRSGSVDIAKDKGYTHYFLNNAGLQTPKYLTFFSDNLIKNIKPEKRRVIADAVAFANNVGYPVFLKPDKLSQGTMVYKVYSDEELVDRAKTILKVENVAIVENACTGNDYRVVVLDDAIISAYQRVPLCVVGNGRNDIETLLVFEKNALIPSGRPNSEINIEDERIACVLSRKKISKNYIPRIGESIQLLDNANLSTGGKAIDVTEYLHPDFKEIALLATKTLGLRFSGVDIICSDITRQKNNQEWFVIEVNGSPGLDNYAAIGEKQVEKVKKMYMRILKSLECLEV